MIYNAQKRRLVVVRLNGTNTPGLNSYRPPAEKPAPAPLPAWMTETPWYMWPVAVAALFFIGKELKSK